MQFQARHKFTATPQGIFLDGEPLNKNAIDALPLRSLRHLMHACEIRLKMTDKDWGPHEPHGPNDIPQCALFEMHLALASPGVLNKYSPDQQRDDKGRWTAVGGTGKSGLERDRLSYDDKGIRIASNDITVPVPFGVPIIPSRKHPVTTGSDALDDALGISSHSSSSSSPPLSWPSWLTPKSEEDCEKQYDRDMDECRAYAAMTRDKYTFVACKRQAERRFSQCMSDCGKNSK